MNGVGRYNCNTVDLLYATDLSGSSFNSLAYSILGYSAPTIIILKHIENN